MSKRHPLDDAFQNRLREYSMPVPKEMWQNIQSEMSRKKYPVWLPWVMGTTAIATLALVGYLLLSGDATNGSKATDAPESTADAKTIQVIDNESDNNTLSNELTIEGLTKNRSEYAVSDEELLNTGGENQREKSNEFLLQAEWESSQKSDVLLLKNTRNSSKKDKIKDVSGKSNANSSEPVVNVTGSSVIKTREHPQRNFNETGYINGPDEIVEYEKNTGAGMSAYTHKETDVTSSVLVPASLNGDASSYYVVSDDVSMGLPKLRKIRDRNCEDEHFNPGNIFLEFSYGLHHGNFKFQSTADIFDKYASLRTNGEQFNLSKQFQGLIAFQVGKRSYFKTGISLNILESDYYFVDQMNKRIIRDSIWNSKTMEYEVTERETDIYIDGVNRYIFVDIPLLFSYGWQFNKVGVNLTTGPMVNISFTREGRLPSLIGQGIDLQNGLWNDRDIYRKTAGLSWFLSTQVSYQAYKNVDIYIEPRIISGLNSITLENDGTETDESKVSYPLSQRIFQYGIGAGLRFSLNNK